MASARCRLHRLCAVSLRMRMRCGPRWTCNNISRVNSQVKRNWDMHGMLDWKYTGRTLSQLQE